MHLIVEATELKTFSLSVKASFQIRAILLLQVSVST
jgi:hypothetical protein